ncbi:Uncharacterised protein [Mycobacteroides abscessus subsp. abscessus]|nr:Uncharacterised protein [Mycobacteroides abscessus subsp. abscessus]
MIKPRNTGPTIDPIDLIPKTATTMPAMVSSTTVPRGSAQVGEPGSSTAVSPLVEADALVSPVAVSASAVGFRAATSSEPVSSSAMSTFLSASAPADISCDAAISMTQQHCPKSSFPYNGTT